MRNPGGRMRVCAEFSGSAGEAPTGIKVAVEAVEEVTWELAFILGGGKPTHPHLLDT